MSNQRYVDDPFEEYDNNSSISVKAREGKTPLQIQALEATGRKRFKDKAEHDLFKKYEEMAAGADPESRVWAAWLANRIMIAKSFNKNIINMTMPNLMASFGNKAKRDIWFTDNRKKVLQKPTAQEIAQSVGVETALDQMEQRMRKRME